MKKFFLTLYFIIFICSFPVTFDKFMFNTNIDIKIYDSENNLKCYYRINSKNEMSLNNRKFKKIGGTIYFMNSLVLDSFKNDEVKYETMRSIKNIILYKSERFMDENVKIPVNMDTLSTDFIELSKVLNYLNSVDKCDLII